MNGFYEDESKLNSHQKREQFKQMSGFSPNSTKPKEMSGWTLRKSPRQLEEEAFIKQREIERIEHDRMLQERNKNTPDWMK